MADITKAHRKLQLQIELLKIACGAIRPGSDVRKAMPDLRDNLIAAGASPDQADEFIEDVQSTLDA